MTEQGYDGNMATPKKHTYLGYAEVAEKIGVTVPVARKYLAESRKNRAAGTPTVKDMPEPDSTFGQSPAWKETTIDAWIARRPGKGTGGGRKPKAKAPAAA